MIAGQSQQRFFIINFARFLAVKKLNNVKKILRQTLISRKSV